MPGTTTDRARPGHVFLRGRHSNTLGMVRYKRWLDCIHINEVFDYFFSENEGLVAELLGVWRWSVVTMWAKLFDVHVGLCSANERARQQFQMNVTQTHLIYLRWPNKGQHKNEQEVSMEYNLITVQDKLLLSINWYICYDQISMISVSRTKGNIQRPVSRRSAAAGDPCYDRKLCCINTSYSSSYIIIVNIFIFLSFSYLQ